MQSYNHPAWSSFDVPSPARPRFASESGTSTPFIPPSLTPGRRVRDKSAIQWPGPTIPSPHQPRRPSLYGDYFLSHPHVPPPPIPQKPQALLNPLTNALPPVPPKPPALSIAPASRIPLYPASIPLPVASPFSQPPESATLETVSDEKEFEQVLTLSASEARKREWLVALEEEELAKALEESRLLSDGVCPLDVQSSSSPSLVLASLDQASFSVTRSPLHPPEGESWLHILTPTTSTSSHSASINEDISPHDSPEPADVAQAYSPRDSLPPTPPLYASVVSNLFRNPFPAPPLGKSSVPSLSSAPGTHPPGDCATSSDRAPGSPSLSLGHLSNSESTSTPPFASRPSWSSVSSENGTSSRRSLGSELAPVSTGHKSPTHPPASPDLSLCSSSNLERLDEEADEDADSEPGPSTRPAVPLRANQYVEQEMLTGISMGFYLPIISTELLPMASKMPNVITLPYGKAPLFHFQAPSWRKLLKLMARLSGTRVEPTVEALSIAKHDLKLRTVIQFVKVHHSASEWRTILYLTTDHPLPAKIQNPHRYTNGDVTLLPYSYTLAPLPPLLRDGSESPMAKYYVVPPTPTTPYPDLPINFPDLAMYLQSAVQDSRRAANDSSCGLRKLAQYIDGCYQTEAEGFAPIDEVVSKKGVGGMFKRVMGRNRSNKHSKGNEEIYDLVTPFVSDEWG